ncbi:MAG: DUF4286 family protein [Bacteroidales bacterium]|jgi:hypothetical protein|nr:DUF4286 family protein [Bacteroidales bacterium]
MTIINNTLSFAPHIQEDAITWLKTVYVHLFSACPLVQHARLLQIEHQGDAEDCFALQIHFAQKEHYTQYKEKYAPDFEQIFTAKFQNMAGIFSTVLHEVE